MSKGTNMATLLNFIDLTPGTISNHKKIMLYQSQSLPKISKVSARTLRNIL